MFDRVLKPRARINESGLPIESHDRQLLEDAPAIGVKVQDLNTTILKPKQEMRYGTLATPACLQGFEIILHKAKLTVSMTTVFTPA